MGQQEHALEISGFKALPVSNGWKWHITFSYGGVITSDESYPTPEVALAIGRTWIDKEAVFNALKQCLCQFRDAGTITVEEYRNLMASFIKTTNHC
ncbi:MAG: hypothetical protein F6K36_03575 [Symploca sp. SIO3C6]|uniref:Uncharacterized protein n=1 Tax=Symploca sp. SIO1C4 TaxID=2607765 RepID=A0A6B3NBY6_9CYAN|nr:hypothetical protein [Symploca sp. SIO3C6]NER29100.1 hypothetical protein [Symploca sp. SIO1C4]NET05263.1 hypothetical protein [Symploca sp. SIO2B6]